MTPNQVRLNVKKLNDIALRLPISELQDFTCHTGLTHLPSDTGECAHLTLAKKACICLTDPGGMEGWVDLCGWLYTEMGLPPTDGHPSKY